VKIDRRTILTALSRRHFPPGITAGDAPIPKRRLKVAGEIKICGSRRTAFSPNHNKAGPQPGPHDCKERACLHRTRTAGEDPGGVAGPSGGPLLDVDGVTLAVQKTARSPGHGPPNRRELSTCGPRTVSSCLGPSGVRQVDLAQGRRRFPWRPSRERSGLPAGTIERPGPGPHDGCFRKFDQLMPWKTVKQNVMFPILASGPLRAPAEAEQAGSGLYRQGEILPSSRTPIRTLLSGGMKQRVAIAGARRWRWSRTSLLMGRAVSAALDALTRRQRCRKELLQASGKTRGSRVLFVTHSIEEAIIVGVAHPRAVAPSRPG